MEIVDDVAEWVGVGLEAAALAVIVFGAVVATVRGVIEWGRGLHDFYRVYRRRLGRVVVVGLEFLVAADIVSTVAISPTFTNVGVLAGVVAVRTFLSFSLELEIEGRWPWQRRTRPESGRPSEAPGGGESAGEAGPPWARRRAGSERGD